VIEAHSRGTKEDKEVKKGRNSEFIYFLHCCLREEYGWAWEKDKERNRRERNPMRSGFMSRFAEETVVGETC
jgi:hypothetical protein